MPSLKETKPMKNRADAEDNVEREDMIEALKSLNGMTNCADRENDGAAMEEEEGGGDAAEVLGKAAEEERAAEAVIDVDEEQESEDADGKDLIDVEEGRGSDDADGEPDENVDEERELEDPDGEPDEKTTKATTTTTTTTKEKGNEELPGGWKKSLVPRKSGEKYDPYWFSPREAYKFNSLSLVRRFLACLEEAGGDEAVAYDSFRKRRSGKSSGDEVVAAHDSNKSKGKKRKSKSLEAATRPTSPEGCVIDISKKKNRPKKEDGMDDGKEDDGDSDEERMSDSPAAVVAAVGFGSSTKKGKTTAPKRVGDVKRRKGGGGGGDPPAVAIAPRVAGGGSGGDCDEALADKDVIDANGRLLDAIASGDYATYRDLTARDLTAIEPETGGHVVQGMDFHKYYFDLMGDGATGGEDKRKQRPVVPVVIHMISPHVRWLGGGEGGRTVAAVISYLRLDQTVKDGDPVTKTTSETRVWEIRCGRLVQVHFHKS
ncbi:hypothetical protein ACHAW5_007325 [Stephanodiscus triporus]|uniref:MBD domain-containing protein n=1 Tax=Stephanodiscus triporus TaxID=2934178 RepID=A0ABD3NHI4_9STRA